MCYLIEGIGVVVRVSRTFVRKCTLSLNHFVDSNFKAVVLRCDNKELDFDVIFLTYYYFM